MRPVLRIGFLAGCSEKGKVLGYFRPLCRHSQVEEKSWTGREQWEGRPHTHLLELFGGTAKLSQLRMGKGIKDVYSELSLCSCSGGEFEESLAK